MEAVSDIDIPEDKITEFNDLCLDYQLASWNLVEPDGTQIPCTLENKKLLMHGEPAFSAWVDARLNKLQADLANVGDVETKNF